MINVELPDIGDFHDVEVIEILVSPGDSVAVEDSLLTLESDKATMEIPSPAAGTVNEIKISVGDKINKGDVIFVLEAGGEADAPAVAPAAEPEAPAEPVVAAPAEPEPTPAAAPAAESESLTIEVPDIGDFKDVEVVEVMVVAGDEVAKEDSLITLETDKATMEIPSPHAGKVTELNVKVGDRVNQGDRIGVIEAVGLAPVTPAPAAAAAPVEESPKPAPAPAAPAERAVGEKEAQRRPVIAKPSDAPKGKAHASPAVRRFARELGVDLYHVPGSGPKGRIVKEDVQAFVKRTLQEGAPQVASSGGGLQLPTPPVVDFSKFGEIEEQELGRIKKISGKHLHNAWLGIPHVTQFDEADITELEAFQRARRARPKRPGSRSPSRRS